MSIRFSVNDKLPLIFMHIPVHTYVMFVMILDDSILHYERACAVVEISVQCCGIMLNNALD